MQNMQWKLIIIAFFVVLSVYSIASNGLKFGKDLAGGLSLTYQINLEDSMDADAVVAQVIDVLNNRVNPTGQLDISIVRQGHDRIEVTMPLPSPAVQELQGRLNALRQAILDGARIEEGGLNSALETGTAVERYGDREGTLFAGNVQALQDAHTRKGRAQASYDAVRAQNDAPPEDIDAAVQELAEAVIQFDRLFNTVLASSLRENEIDRMLGLSDETIDRRDAEGKLVLDENEEKIVDPSPRSVELASMKARYPAVADQLGEVVTVYDQYTSERKGFDDAEDLKRLMRGAGVLEFRIAITTADTSNAGFSVDKLRSDLANLGPDTQTSNLVKWMPINDLKQWYQQPGDLISLRADPISYFASRSGLIAAEYGGKYYLLISDADGKKIAADDDDSWALVSATRTTDRLGRVAVGFQLDTAGGAKMGRLTAANLQKPMAILLDGQVYSAPNINDRIGANGIIQGTFSNEEINYLIRVLASGSIKARLSQNPIAQNILGPEIGADNLSRGLNACLVGIIAVAIFMLCYYFFAGGVADIALLCNGVFIFGIMSMQQASFTLPGIAGIVLTIGMAVDANVLIYERIREEIFGGETDLREAIRIGYGKAISTIIDANVTNLIVCLVLYQTATAEVKGFALTLSIGILATLFTALFVTRVIFALYTDFFKLKQLPMLPTVIPAIHRMLEPRINWIGLRKLFLPISTVLVVGGLALVFSRGVHMLDTEFRGGLSATILLKADPSDPDSGRIMLARSDVEERVRALADDPTLLEGDLRLNFAQANVLAAGADQTDGRSSSFQIKVAADTEDPAEMSLLVNSIVEEFRGELDVSPPATFFGTGELNPPTGTTFPIVTTGRDGLFLGPVIEREGLNIPIDEQFIGGVAILIQDISPPTSLEDVTRRVARMRLQPDFSGAADRVVEVVGVDRVPDQNMYTTVAVLVVDEDYRYGVNPTLWESQLVATEWRLVSQSLEQEATLEQVSSYSGSVANTLRDNAVVAVGMSLIGILVYIWIRFGSLRYSLAAIVALVHDVSIALGLLAATHFIGLTSFGQAIGIVPFRIDLGVVAAMLTIIGYSLNDTIVIMDRIRENRGKRPIASLETVNLSINQTISRTVLTSTTTILAVGIMYIFGGTGIRPFAFCLLIGLFVGTYSSVAVAAPLVFSRGSGPAEGTEPDPEPSEYDRSPLTA